MEVEGGGCPYLHGDSTSSPPSSSFFVVVFFVVCCNKMGGGDKINEVICGQIDGEGEAIDQRSREVGGGGREG